MGIETINYLTYGYRLKETAIEYIQHEIEDLSVYSNLETGSFGFLTAGYYDNAKIFGIGLVIRVFDKYIEELPPDL